MKSLFFGLISCTFLCAEYFDLETLIQDFVLETKRIEILDYPYAFNPSIIRWNNLILMTFRTIPDAKQPFTCQMGVLLLDREFNPIGDPQILEIRDKNSPAPARAEDARLIYIGETLYILYSDNPDIKLSAAGFRMVIAELVYEDGLFSIRNPQRLVQFEGERNVREKSWVPFEYTNGLYLAYSISPHLIFKPIAGTGACTTIAHSNPMIPWDWGIIRGGTPAILLETGEYLSVFHSVKKMTTANSKGKEMSHYFMGAYTFSSQPPFQLLRISKEPIVGPGFYSGTSYKPYWGSVQCVFPAGIITDKDSIWISYGRQDHEIWVVKLDKHKLLDTLIPIE